MRSYEGSRLVNRLILMIVFLAFSLASLSRAEAHSFLGKKIVLKTVNYKLDMKIDYESEKIFASCELSVLNPSSEPISQIPLILYRLMKVTSVEDEQGTDLSFAQQILAYEDWEKLQVNYIEISLINPIQQGEKKTIKIKYEGYLFGYSETGMLYLKDRVDEEITIIRPDCLAYPQVGYPSWKINRASSLQSFDYLISITVPKSLVVANGGRLVGRTRKGEWATYYYRNSQPAWRIDIAIAEYSILEDKARRLRIFYFQEEDEEAQKVFEALKKAMDFSANWFGPWEDFQGFSIIEVPPGFGSQVDVTGIIQTKEAFKRENQLYELYQEIVNIRRLLQRII